MKYSVVVPCYNEEGNVHTLVEEFVKVYNSLKKSGFELVLVNNGSKDNTEVEINDCIKKYKFIKSVVVEVNQGYGYGILKGMSACSGEYIGWIHADLQFSPFLFVKIARAIENESEKSQRPLYFKGIRKNRPFFDCLFTFGMSCFESLYFKTKLWDINAQPTMMRRELFDTAVNPPWGFSLDLYFYYCASKKGYEIKRFVSYQKAREVGKSSWNTGMSARIKLIKRTLHDSKEIKKNLVLES